jgi:glycosyltransferase involved in cell wall biosynthesis
VNADVLQNVRFIASDNCSTDGTATFLSDFAAENHWLEYVVQKENLGLVGNLNAGLKMADTEFIWFMSDDDLMENGVVDKVLCILKKNNVVGNLQFVFLNCDQFVGDVSNAISPCVFSGNGGFYEDGKEIMISAFLESDAMLMFITACVYRRKTLFDSMNIYKNDTAFERPLFDAFTTSAKGAAYWEKQVFVHCRIGECSWIEHYREIFFYGIFNVLSERKLGQLGYSRTDISLLNKCWLKNHMWMFVKYLFNDPKFTCKLFKYFDGKLFALMIKTGFPLAWKRCKKCWGS